MAAKNSKQRNVTFQRKFILASEGVCVSRELLKQFFKDNTTQMDIPTAAGLAHFSLALQDNPEAHEKLRAFMDETIFSEQPGREAEVFEERREIEAAQTCEQVIRLMRRHTDPMNQHILINRALAFEDEIIPELVRMLKTSLNVSFIETAIRVLAKSKKDISDELIQDFDSIRYPYAQSMLLVVLGYKADETHTAWFIDRYKELKRLYPDQSYCEGAYYALCEINHRCAVSKSVSN